MTGKDRDPLELLGRHEDPEPDAEAMRRTIAASRAAFARHATEWHAGRDRRHWLPGSGGIGWLVPAAAGVAAAAVLALVALPALRPDRGADGAGPPATVAEAPPHAGPSAPAAGGRRMGAQTLSRAPQPAVPAGMQRVEDSELPLAYRAAEGRLEFYLLTADGPRQIDAWPVPSDEAAKVTVAFLASATARRPELLVAQINLGSEPARWHAYMHQGNEILRHAEVSAALSDAADRTEAEARLRQGG